MQIFIMTDLEGCAGVLNSADWLYPHSCYYEKAKKILTEEVNAAIRGFANAGFDDIIVNDGHGSGGIDIEILDKRAKLMRGWQLQFGSWTVWPYGLDESFDALAFVGQHAKSGTQYSHLTHTGYWNYLDVAINNISVGEYGQMALVAGEKNIPVIFVSGEKALYQELETLTPQVISVFVKEGTVSGSGDELSGEEYERFHEGAIHLQPIKARELIEKNAKIAAVKFIENSDKFIPIKIHKPYRLCCRLRAFMGKKPLTFEVEDSQCISTLLNKMIKKVEDYKLK